MKNAVQIIIIHGFTEMIKRSIQLSMPPIAIDLYMFFIYILFIRFELLSSKMLCSLLEFCWNTYNRYQS